MDPTDPYYSISPLNPLSPTYILDDDDDVTPHATVRVREATSGENAIAFVGVTFMVCVTIIFVAVAHWGKHGKKK